MRIVVAGLVACVAWASPAFAEGKTIYVARPGTKALEAAQAKAGAADLVFPTLHKALARAAELAQEPGATEVAVLVASGSYEGKAGAGGWALPPLSAPGLRFLILGGYDDAWAARDPFRRPSLLGAGGGTGTPVFDFAAKTRLKELVVGGFVVDCSGRNRYDGDGNLVHEGSRGTPFVAFSQMLVERVVLCDNAILNSGGRVMEPLIAPASPETEIVIANNLFWNDMTPVQVGVGIGWRGQTVKRITLRNNTFLRCWPYNPDPTSSMVGAVTLHNRESSQEIVAEGNLFAHNPGGAFQHDWPEERMPKVTLRGNLFFGNATLFGKQEPGAGVLVGKFGANPQYVLLDAARIADDFGYKVEGNVSVDPGLGEAAGLEVGKAEGGEGHDMTVKGFAHKVSYDPEKLPLPADEKARAFGIRPDEVWKR